MVLFQLPGKTNFSPCLEVAQKCTCVFVPWEFLLPKRVNSEKSHFKIWGLSLKCAQLQLKTLESWRAQYSFASHFTSRGIRIPLRIILATQSVTYLLSRWLGCYSSRQLGSLLYGVLHPRRSHHCGVMGTCSRSARSLVGSKNLITWEFYSWQVPGCQKKTFKQQKEGF